MAFLIVLSITTLLIGINALYVAAEFSTVSTRRSRLAQLASDGNSLAKSLQPIVENPLLLDRYIATCQLGITISSLLLGFYAQSGAAAYLEPQLVRLGVFSAMAAQSITATGLLLVYTVLQAVLGELVPKNIGIQAPERLALITSVPTRWSMSLFRPLIWFFNGSGVFLMRLFGLSVDAEHTHVHAPEEILMLVEESEAGGLLHQEERRLLANTLHMREMLVRQVMIPRTRLLVASVDEPGDSLLSHLAASSYSRLPLYEGSIDNIVGVVHLKDLLCLLQLTDQRDVRAVMRPVLFVPETMRVEQVLAQLQRDHYYVAVVMDEFGGTSGMVTLKDLVEEIFGEFKDEFDLPVPKYRLTEDSLLRVRGDVSIWDMNNWLDLLLAHDDVDTVGGLVLAELGRLPEPGDEVMVQGIRFRVEAMDGNAINVVSLALNAEQAQRMRDRAA